MFIGISLALTLVAYENLVHTSEFNQTTCFYRKESNAMRLGKLRQRSAICHAKS